MSGQLGHDGSAHVAVGLLFLDIRGIFDALGNWSIMSFPASKANCKIWIILGKISEKVLIVRDVICQVAFSGELLPTDGAPGQGLETFFMFLFRFLQFLLALLG